MPVTRNDIDTGPSSQAPTGNERRVGAPSCVISVLFGAAAVFLIGVTLRDTSVGVVVSAAASLVGGATWLVWRRATSLASAREALHERARWVRMLPTSSRRGEAWVIRIQTTVLALLFLLAGVAAAIPATAAELPPGGSFIDDNRSVHEPDIEAIFAADLTSGCNPPVSDRFCPDTTVTRGQMAAFLARARVLPAAAEDHFSDDTDSIFESDINRIATAGITRGCDPPDNSKFCPDDPVTRGQMAAFMVRAFGYTDDGGGNTFIDDNGSVFETDIAMLAAADITKGCNPPANTKFCPRDPVTRAQMASFLARALGLDPIVSPPLQDPVVYAIGDSVMLGASDSVYGFTPNLEGAISNITVDAKESRQFSQGDTVLAARLVSHDPDIVVIGLGTNGPPTSSQFADIMRVAGVERRVLFLTVKLDRSWESTTNSVVRAGVKQYPNAELVDWWALADPHPSWFSADSACSCHLWSTTARTAYIDLIVDTIDQEG